MVDARLSIPLSPLRAKRTTSNRIELMQYQAKYYVQSRAMPVGKSPIHSSFRLAQILALTNRCLPDSIKGQSSGAMLFTIPFVRRIRREYGKRVVMVQSRPRFLCETEFEKWSRDFIATFDAMQKERFEPVSI
jgi:hypothetical protein